MMCYKPRVVGPYGPELRTTRAEPATAPQAASLCGQQVRRLAEPDATDMIQPSSGAHVTLPGYYAGGSAVGVIIPKTKASHATARLQLRDAALRCGCAPTATAARRAA
jgi:hypothetical protein